jgi:hypothetical protein
VLSSCEVTAWLNVTAMPLNSREGKTGVQLNSSSSKSIGASFEVLTPERGGSSKGGEGASVAWFHPIGEVVNKKRLSFAKPSEVSSSTASHSNSVLIKPWL